MKIFFKIASFFLIIIIFIVFYLSIVGVETTKFNKQIQNKIQYFDSNLSLELKKVKLILNEINTNIESVPDPYYGGENGFNRVYKMLDEACEKIIFNIE